MTTNTAPTFNTRPGLVTTNFGSNEDAQSVALQADGKIVVAGTGLARYNTDGSLDTSFGTGGRVTSDAELASVWVLADGKILVAGTSPDANFYVARYTSLGVLDTTFGSNGKVTTDFGATDYGNSASIQSDGSILVTGISFTPIINNTSTANFALVRYTPEGQPDASFGTAGLVFTSLGEHDFAYDVVVQTDGKVVVAGHTYDGTSWNFALVRYNPDGSLDTSFNTSGKVSTDFGREDYAESVKLQADGKIVVAGYTLDADTTDFALARYNPDGTLDASFGNGGKVVTDFGTIDYGSSVALQADGKIVVAGTSQGDGVATFSLARYNPDGSLDLSFGVNGKVTTDYGLGRVAHSVLIQADGKILLVGSANSTGNGGDYALARYNPDGSLDPEFNGGGVRSTLDGNPTYTGIKGPFGSPSAVVLDSNVCIYDAELSGAASYSGATLTLQRHGGANPGDVFSTRSGELSALTAGNYFSVNGLEIGLVVSNGNGTLKLGFNSNATQALVTQTMQLLAYDNTASAPPVSVQIDWTFSDGNTGAQGTGGALSVTGSTVVNITARNAAPTLAQPLADVFVLPDNKFSYVLPANTFADANEGTTLQYSVAMTNGAALPKWMVFDPATHTIKGTPGSFGPFDVSRFDIRVTATDHVGASTSDVFRLSVADNSSPTGTVAVNGGAEAETAVLPMFPNVFSLSQTAPGQFSGSFATKPLVMNNVEFVQFGTTFQTTIPLGLLASGQAQLQLGRLTDLYLAFFGRAPDVSGLEYWQEQLLEAGRDFASISKDFAWSQEALALFPQSASNRAFVQTVYVNCFGRQPDEGGWDYWTAKLDGLGTTDLNDRGAFVGEVILGAYAPTSGAEDRNLLTNRHDAAMYYVNRLSVEPTEGFDPAINDLLAKVTGDSATEVRAEQVIDHAFANPVTLAGIMNDSALLASIWGA